MLIYLIENSGEDFDEYEDYEDSEEFGGPPEELAVLIKFLDYISGLNRGLSTIEGDPILSTAIRHLKKYYERGEFLESCSLVCHRLDELWPGCYFKLLFSPPFGNITNQQLDSLKDLVNIDSVLSDWFYKNKEILDSLILYYKKYNECHEHGNQMESKLRIIEDFDEYEDDFDEYEGYEDHGEFSGPPEELAVFIKFIEYIYGLNRDPTRLFVALGHLKKYYDREEFLESCRLVCSRLDELWPGCYFKLLYSMPFGRCLTNQQLDSLKDLVKIDDVFSNWFDENREILNNLILYYKEYNKCHGNQMESKSRIIEDFDEYEDYEDNEEFVGIPEDLRILYACNEFIKLFVRHAYFWSGADFVPASTLSSPSKWKYDHKQLTHTLREIYGKEACNLAYNKLLDLYVTKEEIKIIPQIIDNFPSPYNKNLEKWYDDNIEYIKLLYDRVDENGKWVYSFDTEAIKQDYLQWSGGFGPEVQNNWHQGIDMDGYLETAAPNDINFGELRLFLILWSDLNESPNEP